MSKSKLESRPASTGGRLSRLEEIILDQNKEMARLAADLKKTRKGGESLSSRVRQARHRLDQINPHRVEGLLDSLTTRAKDVSSSWHLMQLQMAALTECRYQLAAMRAPTDTISRVLNAAIRACDLQPATWWEQRENLATRTWLGEFESLASQYDERDKAPSGSNIANFEALERRLSGGSK